METLNYLHDLAINDYSKMCETGAVSKTGDHVKELVDKVERLKFLRMEKMFENKDALDELVRLTRELHKASNELDSYMKQWRHGA